MPILFFAFISVTFIEIWVMIEVGRLIGSLPTIGLMVLTALVGAVLLRLQGVATWLRARERLASGSLPAQELVEGLLLAFGGALLLTPGFVTDIVGLLCLLPTTRAIAARKVMVRFANRSGISAQFDVFQSRNVSGGTAHEENVIDGEFSRDKNKF